jgi:hypothetical protein
LRSTHRVAIANSRLVSVTDAAVAFRWKDYRHHGKAKVITLAADEFIRRFLLHALPELRWRHGRARCPGAPGPLSHILLG